MAEPLRMPETPNSEEPTTNKSRGGCCLMYGLGWVALAVWEVLALSGAKIYLIILTNQCTIAGGLVTSGGYTANGKYYAPGVFVPLSPAQCGPYIDAGSLLVYGLALLFALIVFLFGAVAVGGILSMSSNKSNETMPAQTEPARSKDTRPLDYSENPE